MRSGWEEGKIEDTLTFAYGAGLPAHKREGKKYPVYGSSGIVGYHNRALVEGPGVIVGRKGSIGTVYYESRNFFPIDTVFYVKPASSDYDIRFLYYMLSEARLSTLDSDAAVPGLNRNVAHQQPVQIPDPATQRKIAAVLSAYDDLIENNTRRIAVLEQMAQSLYHEWFVNFRYPGYEQVPQIRTNAWLPEGWVTKPFSKVATFINGYAFKPEDWGKIGKPIIKIAELKNGVTSATPFHSGEGIPDEYMIKNGDVLFSWSAHLDAYVWAGGDGILNQHLFNVVANKDHKLLYVFYALKSAMEKFRALSLGAIMQHIKRSALSQVDMVVPTINIEQAFDEQVQPIHKQIVNLSEQNSNLRQTRDLLLPRLLSGALDVSGLKLVIGQARSVKTHAQGVHTMPKAPARITPDLEQPLEDRTVELFRELGYLHVNAKDDKPGPGSVLGRTSYEDVVIRPWLTTALRRLNPKLPDEAISEAVEVLTRSYSGNYVAVNKECYALLKEGVKVQVVDADGNLTDHTVEVVDWQQPTNNEFHIVQQLTIKPTNGYNRRPDLLGYVNGLPLVFMELKKSSENVKDAYDDNLRDYKDTIPYLFWYNALIILSNGIESKVGSLTASWDFYGDWKKISDEEEAAMLDLETTVRGTCDPARLLDLVENFTLFADQPGGPAKIVARNHQYLGVNRLVAALEHKRYDQLEPEKLGVFWHTQGSGKSYSMVFFAEKVMRKLGGWQFVVVTDRDDLDDQAYQYFARVGVARKGQQAGSGAELQQMLRQNSRYVFTLIQKFQPERGATTYPVLNTSDRIIVIVDEAHRTQGGSLALNMRNALPNARFVAFTGTPLIKGSDEEATKKLFGDYVSRYDFGDAVRDGATLPLYYESRLPEMKVINEQLNEQMAELVEQVGLSDEEQQQLVRNFAKQYSLITNPSRLDAIATDIVQHFMGRGFLGKAMIASIDKATAVKMYDRVRKLWQQEISKRQGKLNKETEQAKHDLLAAEIKWLSETDMAVVVSSAQNEVADLEAKGVDIRPHRLRMSQEDLSTRYKDPTDPLRIVFVCAMWMTGFDAPSVSTVYLDKPMKDHTLMQTIARANRVFEGKASGTIVDYIGVFSNLQTALAIYAGRNEQQGDTANEGDGDEDEGAALANDLPVADKSVEVAQLQQALASATQFCTEKDANLPATLPKDAFAWAALVKDVADKMLANDETEAEFRRLVRPVERLYKAILPDKQANHFAALVTILRRVADRIENLKEQGSDDLPIGEVEALLDDSAVALKYKIAKTNKVIDLSVLDLEAIQQHIAAGHANTAAQQLRGVVGSKLNRMVRQNPARVDYQEKFQKLVDEYNTGSKNVQDFIAALKQMVAELDVEQQRHITEGLTEDELAVFDLLLKSGPELTGDERKQVKKVAKEVLNQLHDKLQAVEWQKNPRSSNQVFITIRSVLGQQLPTTYSMQVKQEGVDTLYAYVLGAYSKKGQVAVQAA